MLVVVHTNTVNQGESINQKGKIRNLENSQGKRRGLMPEKLFSQVATNIERREGGLNGGTCR
jgi:hypothetical protein